ncbi:MAG: hypothetical protein V3W18_00930 [candidate division Zixibacteria bacterium]
MMINRILILPVMIIGFLMVYPSVSAGRDCDQSIGEVLERIENHDQNGDRQELLELLRCLWAPAVEFIDDYDKFASNRILDDIEEATHNDRLDVIRVLDPMMVSKDQIIRGEVAAALAYYRYPWAKQLLSDYPDGPQKAVFYAILDYKRMYRWAIDQLTKTDIRERNGESDLLTERMAYMNLVFHLAEPASLPYLDRTIGSTSEKKIKDRARMARDRILKLYPKIK